MGDVIIPQKVKVLLIHPVDPKPRKIIAKQISVFRIFIGLDFAKLTTKLNNIARKASLKVPELISELIELQTLVSSPHCFQGVDGLLTKAIISLMFLVAP